MRNVEELTRHPAIPELRFYKWSYEDAKEFIWENDRRDIDDNEIVLSVYLVREGYPTKAVVRNISFPICPHGREEDEWFKRWAYSVLRELETAPIA